jgi:hypothetical protein
MSKFLKFNIVNTTAPLTQGVQLINVEQIQSVVYNAGALTIVLDGAVGIQAAVDPAGTNPNQAAVTYGARVVTLTVVATKDGTGGAPTITNGAKSPQKAVYAAMTANPGGVQSTVQLGLDESATPAQMYFSVFAIATAAIV